MYKIPTENVTDHQQLQHEYQGGIVLSKELPFPSASPDYLQNLDHATATLSSGDETRRSKSETYQGLMSGAYTRD